jgi:3-phenylpropionate/cinnamic acid dioxygenase small subunit
MDEYAELLDKDRIIDRVNQLFIATDRRDWAAVRACFTETVHFDMTSVAGGEPAMLTPEQITAAWEQGLRPLEAIHHQAGNYRAEVRGDEATGFCYGTATHYRRTRSGRNTRTFVGSYDFEFVRRGDAWRITSFRFNLKYLDGNLDLEKD